MKMVLNASFLLQPEWTGVCRYLYQQIYHLARVRLDNTIHLLFFVPRHHKKLFLNLKFPHNVIKQAIYLPQRLCEPLDQVWQHFQRPSIDSLVGPHDVYISPAWSFLPSNAPLTGIFALDTLSLAGNDHNHHLEKKRLETSLSKNTSIWITISNFSKQKLISDLNVNPIKIVVAYPGCELQSHPKPDPIKYPYVYYVGSNEPRKNLSLAFTAFNRFHQFHRNWQFIVMSKDIISMKNQFSYPWLRILPYGSNQVVQNYLSQAQCLVYPSFEEGFGLPVLEALKAKTLVITSENSSMVEITGANWPLLCNPHSLESLSLRFDKLATLTLKDHQKLINSLDLSQFDYIVSANKIWQSIESAGLVPKTTH
jgi:glycosyltransferase involved in cell wall biosynthesis